MGETTYFSRRSRRQPELSLPLTPAKEHVSRNDAVAGVTTSA
jgi:hypothetical protein